MPGPPYSPLPMAAAQFSNRRSPVWPALSAAAGGAALALAPGCRSPFQDQASQELRTAVVESAQRQLRPSEGKSEVAPVTREPGALTIPPERMAELEKMAGPAAYERTLPPMGNSLLGKPDEVFRIDLRQAVQRAVRQNLDVQIARLDPAITESQVVAARAAFDWVFFSTFEWSLVDEPQIVPVIGVPLGTPASQNQTAGYTTGIRKRLTSGGGLSISQGYTYRDDSSPFTMFFPDPAQQAFLDLTLTQPLLRGFGSDVALAEVRLSENAERSAVHGLKARLLDTATSTERAYWDLVTAFRNLQILQRLLERGIETRDVLKSRLTFDVKPAEYSDAVAQVESRRADVMRGINAIRQRSDALKALINDDELTVGSETLLMPVDEAVDEPISSSLFDALSTAVRNRPEIQQSLLLIDDSSIRAGVADNARLPLLDLTFQARFAGLDGDFDEAYRDIGSSNFVDYLVQLLFEYPIGNRGPEAQYRQRQLERMQATIGYRRVVQEVVLAVKTALRNVETNYRLIEQTRTARLAAAENLRTLQVQEQTIQSLTPDFLDLKLRRQQALAQAELEEVLALTGYNIAIAELYSAMGTALERNRIRFVAPDAGDPASGPRERNMP